MCVLLVVLELGGCVLRSYLGVGQGGCGHATVRHGGLPLLVWMPGCVLRWGRWWGVREAGTLHVQAPTHACPGSVRRRYPELWEALEVVKEAGSVGRTSAVDLSVYSRTRHFRAAWSCKGGK